MALAWAALLGGCFYVDPVNSAPIVAIDVPPGPYTVNATYTFTADGADPDGDALRYEWLCLGPGCTTTSGTGATFAMRVADHEAWRISLTAIDAHGARASSTTDPLAPEDRPPTFAVAIATAKNREDKYTVGSSILIGAKDKADADGDSPIDVDATVVQAPPGSDPGRATFVPAGEDLWSLVPDVTGAWTVRLTAADRFGGTFAQEQRVDVGDDVPPCLAVTPDAGGGRYVLVRDGGERRFAVARVIDDLDPYPGGGARFAWSLGFAGAAPAAVAGHDLGDFTLDPADYLPGDVLWLRVEVADRAAGRTLPCGALEPRCSIDGDDCLQRETWELEIR